MQLKTKKRIFRTWIEISKSALMHNLKVFRGLVGPNVKIACIVKANAYGHGLKEVVPILDEAGVDWFGVDSLEEALEIRALGINKQILILGYTPFSGLKEVVENGISLTVYNKESLQKILSLKMEKKAKIHLKVETGLNRQGQKADEILDLAKLIIKNKDLFEMEGLSTHFANIEDTLNSSFAFEQLRVFKETIRLLRKNKINPPIKHCAASAAAFLYPETHFNMIRVGISLYGLWPSKETQIALSLKKTRRKLSLKPVLAWKSVLAQMKTVDQGESVGYGRTWFASRKSVIGIVPVGYYDGYDRKLSNNSRILINGQSAPVVGRVAMNMIMVDLTNLKKTKTETEVVLIGKSDENEISADEFARRIGTINYEVVSRINSFLPRVVV
jgi:alanine racemase